MAASAAAFLAADVTQHFCWSSSGLSPETCCKGDASTTSDCWESGVLSFSECCPNSDCWDESAFTYEECCDVDKYGEDGNSGCWSGAYSYDRCCLASRAVAPQTWVAVLAGDADTDQFYGMDEFYTDAQYGEDFGYYSTGRVLAGTGSAVKGAQEFAHFTTFPMALSPHFGRNLCRLLFLKWVYLDERAPFRVVEMGAGSGQLGEDIQRCVQRNELGLEPSVWRRWMAAFEYLILERSPALARRQRQRGLRVIEADAQQAEASCSAAVSALAASDACAFGGEGAPECMTGSDEVGASAVLSNELLDAFAPVKLRLNLDYANGDPSSAMSCAAWQELRLIHSASEESLLNVAKGLGQIDSRGADLIDELKEFTEELFCYLANSTIGRAAAQAVGWSDPAFLEGSSCMALVLGLGELVTHVDLQLPAAAHSMRLRLHRDADVANRLKDTVDRLREELKHHIAIPKAVYRQLRHQLRTDPELELYFLWSVVARQMPVPLSERRCTELSWWLDAHHHRIVRLGSLYRPLGYHTLQFLVRPGERSFMELVDCITAPGAFMLAVDYGASFEALGHSLSVDTNGDGIFLPPIPTELLDGLPDCTADWTRCAGRVDWTSFVDFTNVAAAGEQFGWRTLFYGPQSLLEQVSRRNVTYGSGYFVPGYSTLAANWASQRVQDWYGHEAVAGVRSEEGGWQQRWTSFKALLLERPKRPDGPKPGIVVFPSWHLDADDLDSCWRLDPSSLALADWVRRQKEEDPRAALELLSAELSESLGRQYAEAYEEAQLAVRIVDWMVATEGCEMLAPAKLSTTLNSRGLWKSTLLRVLRAWQDVWGAVALERVVGAVLHRIAAESDEPGAPSECLGQRTYWALCRDPGDGALSRRPTYALG